MFIKRLIAAGLSLGTMAGISHAQSTNEPPKQVNVSVKVVEFQTQKGVETGLSAYLARVSRPQPYGGVTTPNGAITSADLTFPTSTAAGLSVFLDRIDMDDYSLEVVLQALADENRAFILSRPKALVMVGPPGAAAAPAPSAPPPGYVAPPPGSSVIKTVVKIPYEETVVVGYTPVQATQFRDTGVTLVVSVPEVIDDDNDWTTMTDTYAKLQVFAEVNEVGQYRVVSLDSKLAGGADFSLALNSIQAPEFVSRSVNTHVWVRHGQVLILGGLYRNTKDKDLTTLPWLAQAEDTAIALAERIIPGNFLGSPFSSTLGNRSVSEGRRELVFLIKVEAWYPAYTIVDHGFTEVETTKEKPTPTDVISDVIQGITGVPKGIAEGLSGQSTSGDGVRKDLGGME